MLMHMYIYSIFHVTPEQRQAAASCGRRCSPGSPALWRRPLAAAGPMYMCMHMYICIYIEREREISLLYIMLYHIMLHHATSCYIVLYNVISCYIMLYQVISGYVIVCHVMSCNVMSCYVMIWYVMLSYVIVYCSIV